MWESFRNVGASVDEPLKASKDDVRGTRSPLPIDVLYYLNDVQRIALHSLENFGWQLAFIRRPLFMPPKIIVKNDSQKKFAVLEEDGSMDLAPSIKWRH
ncbi:MAG: hypothetical protein EOO68_12950 [Moraxellaceae bacterium]|nr:MAG: hypothetical protein EOO68_12950 [Moraxellaceae bacterium]